jgi:hypothetical protein
VRLHLARKAPRALLLGSRAEERPPVIRQLLRLAFRSPGRRCFRCKGWLYVSNGKCPKCD